MSNGFLNKVQIIGNLGRDPEVRATQNGGTIATLSVATSESWTDKQSGERIERTEWHRVAILNNDGLCKVVERYLTKGAKVYVEGQLKTRKWTDNTGVDRYVTEIHLTQFNGTLTFLDRKRDAEDRTTRREPTTAGADGGAIDPFTDDVPF